MASSAFGMFVRSRRKELGLTQQILADRIGTSAAYLSQIETGTKGWPQKYVLALARELGVSEVELAVAAGVISPAGAEVQAA